MSKDREKKIETSSGIGRLLEVARDAERSGDIPMAVSAIKQILEIENLNPLQKHKAQTRLITLESQLPGAGIDILERAANHSPDIAP